MFASGGLRPHSFSVLSEWSGLEFWISTLLSVCYSDCRSYTETMVHVVYVSWEKKFRSH
jgi:hypothetical protein